MKQMELYIHIPFCVKKCAYCDFLSAPASDSVIQQYVETMKEQLKIEAASFLRKNTNKMQEADSQPEDVVLRSIFIGGGTPSILSGEQIEAIAETIRENYKLAEDIEFTMELNPGTLDLEKIKAIKRAGVNRISIGLQSANNEELKLLGRIHTFEEFRDNYKLLRKEGFTNINVDVMSALPGQDLNAWQQTLRQVVALEPEHISAYSLIIEEGTPFFERYYEDEARRIEGETPHILPSEETERAIYEWTGSFLKEHGYEHYEISNYSKPGFACRHNVGYWTGEEYIGVGLGAASYIEGTRYHMTENLLEYLEKDFEKKEAEQLTREAQMEEFCFLGLRMMQGISKAEFLHRFGQSIESAYEQVLNKLKKQKLIKEAEDCISLTNEGISVSNYVMSEFLL